MALWSRFVRSKQPAATEHSNFPTEAELTSHPVLDAIRTFLADETNSALAIYGPWGVGKTYTWKRLLDEALHSGRLAKRRYAYTSLFGIATLDAFRASIFENTNWLLDPNIDNDEVNELKRVGNFTLEKFKQHKYALAAIPYVGKVIQDAGPFYFATVRSQLICIDDVERRGSSLSVQDVLGLVSFLKEQRDCKLIVLLNEGELGDAKNDFDKNAEKVFDVSLKFDPTSFEAAEIAIKGANDF